MFEWGDADADDDQGFDQDYQDIYDDDDNDLLPPTAAAAAQCAHCRNASDAFALMVAGEMTLQQQHQQQLKEASSCGRTPLHAAAASTSVSADVLQILLREFDVDARDCQGRTACHVAAEISNVLVLRALLDAGADATLLGTATSERTSQLVVNATELDSAAHADFHSYTDAQQQALLLLVAAGADPNVADSFGWTPCHQFVRDDNIAALSALIAAHADVNRVDRRGVSPIHLAAKRRQNDDDTLMAMLLAAGGPQPNVNSIDHDGATPLMLAAAGDSARVARRLLDAGAAASAVNPRTHNTALHEAVLCGSERLVSMLLAAGANVNATTVNRLTPLNIAVMHRKESILRLLVDAGASASAPFVDRSTPLHCAVRGGALAIVLLVLAAGADVDCTDRHKRTPLHYAVIGLQAEIVEHLLVRGASRQERDLVLLNNNSNVSAACMLARRRIVDALLAPTDMAGKGARQLFNLRARQVLVGLQPLGLDALCLSEIVRAAIGRIGLALPFHTLWTAATTVKHYH
jgi:ankyrin repeat protein